MAGRGNSPQRALLGQLMLDEFAFASYLPPLSAQTQRVAVPPSFHVPVPIDANSQEGGGGSFPELPITAHSLPAQLPAPHRPAVPRGERCWWRAHPTNLQEFWSMRGSHHGTGCLPNVPAGRLCPPAFPHPVSQVEKKNPSFGTHSDVLSAQAISCRLPRGNKEVWFATTSPREHFGLVLSVSDGPSVPVWENRASLRGTRCRGGTPMGWWAWLVGWDAPQGSWGTSWNEISLESPKAVAVEGRGTVGAQGGCASPIYPPLLCFWLPGQPRAAKGNWEESHPRGETGPSSFPSRWRAGTKPVIAGLFTKLLLCK